TALEPLFILHGMEREPKNTRSINQSLGGYGAGLAPVAPMNQRVRKASGTLSARKHMHEVFEAHASTHPVVLPDQDTYRHHRLCLGKRSVAPYVDDSDVVGFLKLQTFTTGDGERKKAMSDGTRLLVCYATASNVSKNRYGIEDDIVFEPNKNPFAGILPAL